MPRTDAEIIAELEARGLALSPSVANYTAIMARIQSLRSPADIFGTIADTSPAAISAAVAAVSGGSTGDTHAPTTYPGATIVPINPTALTSAQAGTLLKTTVEGRSAGTASNPIVFQLQNQSSAPSTRFLYEMNGQTIEPKSYHYFVGPTATRTLVQTRTAPDGTSIPAYSVSNLVAIRSTAEQGLFRPVTNANNILLENIECYGPEGTKVTGNDATKKYGRIVNGDRGTIANITAKWCHFHDWNNAVIGGCEGTIMEDCYAHDGGSDSFVGCCASVVKAGNGDIYVIRSFFDNVVCTGEVWTDCDAGDMTVLYTTLNRSHRTGAYFEVSGGSGVALIKYCAFGGNNSSNYERGGGASCISSKNFTVEQCVFDGDNTRQGIHIRNDNRSNGTAVCGPGGWPASNVLLKNLKMNGDAITGTDLAGVTTTGIN